MSDTIKYVPGLSNLADINKHTNVACNSWALLELSTENYVSYRKCVEQYKFPTKDELYRLKLVMIFKIMASVTVRQNIIDAKLSDKSALKELAQKNTELKSLYALILSSKPIAAPKDNTPTINWEEYIRKYNDQEALDIFGLLPSEFVFTSGAGRWATEITLNVGGTFIGQYHDSDLGDSGIGYSNGTVYICNFSGIFTVPKKVNEYIYSMHLESLDVEGTPGTVYYENDTRYIVSDPYGFNNADEFLIYLPGCPLEETSEDFLSWSFINSQIRNTIPSGIYNI